MDRRTWILTPNDPARASGSRLFEISNRGGKGLLTTFNRATPASLDLGSFVPFARTAAEREGTTDPRRSVAQRHASKHEYLGRVSEATLDLVRQGYILREATPLLIERAAARWDWVTGQTPRQTARP